MQNKNNNNNYSEDQNSLNSLSNELHNQILSYLNRSDFKSMATASYFWRTKLNDITLWQQFLPHHLQKKIGFPKNIFNGIPSHAAIAIFCQFHDEYDILEKNRNSLDWHLIFPHIIEQKFMPLYYNKAISVNLMIKFSLAFLKQNKFTKQFRDFLAYFPKLYKEKVLGEVLSIDHLSKLVLPLPIKYIEDLFHYFLQAEIRDLFTSKLIPMEMFLKLVKQSLPYLYVSDFFQTLTAPNIRDALYNKRLSFDMIVEWVGDCAQYDEILLFLKELNNILDPNNNLQFEKYLGLFNILQQNINDSCKPYQCSVMNALLACDLQTLTDEKICLLIEFIKNKNTIYKSQINALLHPEKISEDWMQAEENLKICLKSINEISDPSLKAVLEKLFKVEKRRDLRISFAKLVCDTYKKEAYRAVIPMKLICDIAVEEDAVGAAQYILILCINFFNGISQVPQLLTKILEVFHSVSGSNLIKLDKFLYLLANDISLNYIKTIENDILNRLDELKMENTPENVIKGFKMIMKGIKTELRNQTLPEIIFDLQNNETTMYLIMEDEDTNNNNNNRSSYS